jgi:tRNA(Ile)-lysidine synthase
MHKSAIYQQLKKSLNSYIEQGNTAFAVALSGGVDSVVLLHLMRTLKADNPAINVSAIYVHHG